MSEQILILAAAAGAGPAGRRRRDAVDVAALEAELRATETAFAKSMADRDLTAFATVPRRGRGVLRRRRAAARARGDRRPGWARFFEDKAAPFAWAPQDVFVLSSGELGLSSGPVYGPDGTQVSFFTSTWRREPDGRWLIVLDRGCRLEASSVAASCTRSSSSRTTSRQPGSAA